MDEDSVEDLVALAEYVKGYEVGFANGMIEAAELVEAFTGDLFLANMLLDLAGLAEGMAEA